ncbi:MAG TPA: biopolymer transporter ExbD [Williamwhitmania sp.]|nr:biopolymer transporter ExbD [Williamwhitmania sp.]
MAEIVQEEKQEGGKKKPKKHSVNIDMTPMVDLMCLLITFFMLTTAFSKSKVMEIVLPEKLTKNVDPPKIAESRTLNIILGPHDKVYWYPGKADPRKLPLPILQETDYSDKGIRQILLERNQALFRKIDQFKSDVLTGKIEIPRDSVQSAIRKLKKEDDTGPIVLIKASKEARYANVVDIIDEMSICGIARYALVDINYVEVGMLKSATQGQTAATPVPTK